MQFKTDYRLDMNLWRRGLRVCLPAGGGAVQKLGLIGSCFSAMMLHSVASFSASLGRDNSCGPTSLRKGSIAAASEGSRPFRMLWKSCAAPSSTLVEDKHINMKPTAAPLPLMFEKCTCTKLELIVLIVREVIQRVNTQRGSRLSKRALWTCLVIYRCKAFS